VGQISIGVDTELPLEGEFGLKSAVAQISTRYTENIAGVRRKRDGLSAADLLKDQSQMPTMVVTSEPVLNRREKTAHPRSYTVENERLQAAAINSFFATSAIVSGFSAVAGGRLN
jgi:hypothetical protein